MRPLQLRPRHAVSRLAFSPDGRRLVIGQTGHGVRVIDVDTGADAAVHLMHSPTANTRSFHSATGRATLSLGGWDLRFAAVAAGGAEFQFQSGWRRVDGCCTPPDEPAGGPVPACGTSSSVHIYHHGLLDNATLWFRLSHCALSAGHRLAVGSTDPPGAPAVFDLARERVVARLGHDNVPAFTLHAHFAPDGRALVADARGVRVFELPDRPPAEAEPGSAAGPPALPVIAPAAVVEATKPQPDREPPPFALLPGGRRMIVRGERSRVELRDVATGDVLTVWKWRIRRLLSLAVSPDGLTAAAGGVGGQMMLWDLE